jgi:uncharacterized protein (DUF983 family)
MDGDRVIGTTLTHSDFGGPDCCGCLNGIVHGHWAYIVCNECKVVVRSVRAEELPQTLTEMEVATDVAAELCPHCLSVNLFPGFTTMLAYICQRCGKPVSRAADPGSAAD